MRMPEWLEFTDTGMGGYADYFINRMNVNGYGCGSDSAAYGVNWVIGSAKNRNLFRVEVRGIDLLLLVMPDQMIVGRRHV